MALLALPGLVSGCRDSRLRRRRAAGRATHSTASSSGRCVITLMRACARAQPPLRPARCRVRKHPLWGNAPFSLSSPPPPPPPLQPSPRNLCRRLGPTWHPSVPSTGPTCPACPASPTPSAGRCASAAGCLWQSTAGRSCAVLCCAVLCCAVLCCAVLCCAVLCCAVLCVGGRGQGVGQVLGGAGEVGGQATAWAWGSAPTRHAQAKRLEAQHLRSFLLPSHPPRSTIDYI